MCHVPETSIERLLSVSQGDGGLDNWQFQGKIFTYPVYHYCTCKTFYNRACTCSDPTAVHKLFPSL